MGDFRSDLPIADIRLGEKSDIRFYGYADIDPPLVEARLHLHGGDDVLRLTVDQAEAIGRAFIKAATEVRHRGR